MADATIGGNLPVGDGNGLAAIASQLIEDPHRMHVMVAVVDCQKITRKTDTGENVATARIRRIEAVLPQDYPQAEVLLRRSLEARTGRETLPLDLEQEITAAFADIDPDADDDQGDEAGEAGE